jgi:hypothetical protein
MKNGDSENISLHSIAPSLPLGKKARHSHRAHKPWKLLHLVPRHYLEFQGARNIGAEIKWGMTVRKNVMPIRQSQISLPTLIVETSTAEWVARMGMHFPPNGPK